MATGAELLHEKRDAERKGQRHERARVLAVIDAYIHKASWRTQGVLLALRQDVEEEVEAQPVR